MEEELSLVLEGLEKRVNSRGMKGLPYFLSIAIPGSRIFAVDLTSLDGEHRWEMLPKETTVIDFHPQEAVITFHCKVAVKREIPRPDLKCSCMAGRRRRMKLWNQTCLSSECRPMSLGH